MFFFLFLPVFSHGGMDFPQRGIASWYGIEYAGKPTASGEPFNPEDMTAAHRTLPFGTVVKVTNTHNGKHVIVRINDRGPFVRGRIIDLSRRAAEELDMILTGTAPVIVEAADDSSSSVQPLDPAAELAETVIEEPIETAADRDFTNSANSNE